MAVFLPAVRPVTSNSSTVLHCTALYCTGGHSSVPRDESKQYSSTMTGTTLLGAGQDLANKSAKRSWHRHTETSRSAITTISLILDNKDETT
jgi:hypothetical protein